MKKDKKRSAPDNEYTYLLHDDTANQVEHEPITPEEIALIDQALMEESGALI